MFEQGDLESWPCEICYLVAVDQPDDEISEMTLKLMELLSGGLSHETPPPWELLLRAAGVTNIERFAEVWYRLGMVRRIQEDAAQRRQPQNGQPAPQG
jgi:hypothetical protein